MYFYLRSHSEAMLPAPKRAPPPRVRVVGGGGRSARVGLRVEMGPLRKSISAKVDFSAPRRRRPRTPAPPKSPKRCPYQRPGPGPRPPLARRAGGGGGVDYRAIKLRTGAAAGALRRGRRALRS